VGSLGVGKQTGKEDNSGRQQAARKYLIQLGRDGGIRTHNPLNPILTALVVLFEAWLLSTKRI
jgi:hypothetical protein